MRATKDPHNRRRDRRSAPCARVRIGTVAGVTVGARHARDPYICGRGPSYNTRM
jgi:hypothetical protein